MARMRCGQRADPTEIGRISMTTVAEKAAGIDKTPYARLEQEGRLFNPILKGPTKKKGRYGFRGDIALKFQVALADEKRPPEYSFELVITVADENDKTISVLA